MHIKRIAIGNSEDAFIEDNFTDGFNIINSEDNNKGKTIVMQGIMFSLGNEPAFPTAFNYVDYYFYIELEHKEERILICRRKNNYIVNHKKNMYMFDTTSELKKYWDKEIFALPKIVKDGRVKMVDLVLYMQLFSIGQDNKSTSDISNRGQYVKGDFMNMIYDIYYPLDGDRNHKDNIEELKKEKKIIEEQYKLLLKENKALSNQKSYASYFSTFSEQQNFEKNVAAMQELTEKITEVRKEKNQLANKKLKWESTLKEINSLNRNIESGLLVCMDCGSVNIKFSSNEKKNFSFDVSTIEMRKSIIESINNKLDSYTEELEKIDDELDRFIKKLNKLMNVEDVPLEVLIAKKHEFYDVDKIELQINELVNQLKELKNNIISAEKGKAVNEAKKTEVENLIIELVENTYRTIDPEHQLNSLSIFTKKTERLSGSEGTIFHLARLKAFQEVFKHQMPIIIDSFRAEDLSSEKEERVLELFSKVTNQLIFSTTLKEEEKNKYDNYEFINSIDYSKYTAYKLLQKSNVKIFKQILSNVNVFV